MADLLGYLVPTNGFEFLFFLVIFGSAIVIAILVRINANAKSWDINWQSGTPKENVVECDVCKGTGLDPENNELVCPKCLGAKVIVDGSSNDDAEKDDLHPEHGSVFELSDHVMTASEKCAEVLPSTLLVVGLLGTFLGVGMALDDAAGAIASISSSNVSADAANSLVDNMKSMVDNMKGMIEGMGGQFKSSIYGILASLGFTFWRSKFGSEKERVRWVLTKCNEENKTGDGAFQEFVCGQMKFITDSVNAIKKSVGRSLKETISEGYESRNAAFAEILRNTVNPSIDVLDLSRQTLDTSTRLVSKMEQMAKSIEENLGAAAKAAEEMGTKTGSFTKAVNTTLPKLAEASEKMGEGMDKLVNDLVDDMKNKQDKLFNMVQAAEEQKLKAALAVNEVVEGSIKNLADTNAGVSEKLDMVLKNLTEVCFDMASAAGKDVANMPALTHETEKRDKSLECLEKIVSQLVALDKTMQGVRAANVVQNEKMNHLMESIQAANAAGPDNKGLFNRFFRRN